MVKTPQFKSRRNNTANARVKAEPEQTPIQAEEHSAKLSVNTAAPGPEKKSTVQTFATSIQKTRQALLLLVAVLGIAIYISVDGTLRAIGTLDYFWSEVLRAVLLQRPEVFVSESFSYSSPKGEKLAFEGTSTGISLQGNVPAIEIIGPWIADENKQFALGAFSLGIVTYRVDIPSIKSQVIVQLSRYPFDDGYVPPQSFDTPETTWPFGAGVGWFRPKRPQWIKQTSEAFKSKCADKNLLGNLTLTSREPSKDGKESSVILAEQSYPVYAKDIEIHARIQNVDNGEMPVWALVTPVRLRYSIPRKYSAENRDEQHLKADEILCSQFVVEALSGFDDGKSYFRDGGGAFRLADESNGPHGQLMANADSKKYERFLEEAQDTKSKIPGVGDSIPNAALWLIGPTVLGIGLLAGRRMRKLHIENEEALRIALFGEAPVRSKVIRLSVLDGPHFYRTEGVYRGTYAVIAACSPVLVGTGFIPQLVLVVGMGLTYAALPLALYLTVIGLFELSWSAAEGWLSIGLTVHLLGIMRRSARGAPKTT